VGIPKVLKAAVAFSKYGFSHRDWACDKCKRKFKYYIQLKNHKISVHAY